LDSLPGRLTAQPQETRKSASPQNHRALSANPYSRLWREAGDQTSFRVAAIRSLELQRREDKRRESIETNHPGCILRDSGPRKTSPTGEF
jgi:hypothetical protein